MMNLNGRISRDEISQENPLLIEMWKPFKIKQIDEFQDSSANQILIMQAFTHVFLRTVTFRKFPIKRNFFFRKIQVIRFIIFSIV